jgi:site-specific recombinase XerD
MTNNFDPTLWHPETLQLTQAQESSLPLLQEVITKSKSEVARALRLCEPLDWTHTDIRKLETDLLKHVTGRLHLSQVYDILPKVIARYHERTNSNCCFPLSISRVRLENNPFHADVAASQRLINQLSDFVAKTANDLPHAREADPAWFEKAVTLGVLSSIVQFHLLHKSMLIALVESLANREKSLLSANKHCYCWSLSLAWQGEPDAEHRIFVPDQLTGALFASVPEAEIHRIFAIGLDQSQPLKKRHKAIYAALEQACRKLFECCACHQQIDLKIILQAAGTVAYLRMPAAIAAARCRKTVHHSPRNKVMLRIFRGLPIRKTAPISVENRLSSSEFRDAELEVDDTAQVVPGWLEAMRTAFKLETKSKVRDALRKIQVKEAQPGPRLAHFASSLMTENHFSIGSAKAYGMLIARRLGCRIGNIDPSTLSIAELEDLYRDALDDDWDDDPVGVTDHTIRRNKRATIGAILKFHRYLRKHTGVPALDELASRLKLRGLLPVDANFLTIDEYLCVLDYISGCHGPADPYLRSVLRLIVILAYRCGLRRSEVIYLLIDDLDSAEHLHVRNNELRNVKTTNSARSVPAGILLSSKELAELAEFFQARKNSPRSRATAFLFSSKNDASTALDSDSLVRHIHVAMRSALKDETLRVHHLRHSFATLLTAKLLPNTTPFARAFLTRHPKTLEWLDDRHVFREQLFGTLDITSLDLKAVAHLLGHGSSTTSVEHYIHSLDWFELAVVRR